jgi:DNA-binding transcriptional MocR family regulator
MKEMVSYKEPHDSDIPLYLKVARQIERHIRKGALRVGDRVPSIRGLKRQQGVSVSTVLQAYWWLENQGWIEPRPQSGFYVRIPYAELVPEPAFNSTPSLPANVSSSDILDEIVRSIGNQKMIPLGTATASPELFPNRKLNQIIQKITRTDDTLNARYDLTVGLESLRQQVARRAIAYGCDFSPNEVVVTCGAMEALNLALRAVARAGDVIALESPTYFAFLQMIGSLGIKAVEIPTHPRHGMDLGALDAAITKHGVRACMSITNCHNPLGYILEEDYKQDLVALLRKHDVPLIEDDIYGDLAFNGVRPKTAKTFDTKGLVLLCSSFSKVLAPGFRVGWLQPGRYLDAVRRLKFINSLATASLPQMAVAEFIRSGGFDRHLRNLRSAFANQVQIYSQAIARHFPEGTRISRPSGGYVLWVELPECNDALELYRAAVSQGISLVPGFAFSPTGRFKNHLRVSCGHPFTESIEKAVITLGKLCRTRPTVQC